MELTEENNSIILFECGPRPKCVDGFEHDYSDYEEIENGGTSVCSKCGHRAIDDACWD